MGLDVHMFAKFKEFANVSLHSDRLGTAMNRNVKGVSANVPNLKNLSNNH